MKEDKFIISQKAYGLGDAICGLYTIYGLIDKYPKADITYMTRFVDWLRWWHQGYRLTSIQNIESINLWENYESEKLLSIDRKQWYCNQIENSLVPKIPKFDKIQFLKDIKSPIENKNYFVIAPFATTEVRTWPKGNWIYLIKLLKELNYEVILLDGPGDGQRHKDFPCMRYWGQKPEIVYNLLWNSKGLIANDSGMSHIGGLLDIKTFSIAVQFHPKNLFSLTNNIPIYRDISCSGCQFDTTKGYSTYCEGGCWVLNSITPENVIKEVIKYEGN
jgi:ADP-heptose:LPS heptosyltransferase